MKLFIIILQLIICTQILFAQSFTEVMGTSFEDVSMSYIAFANLDGDSDQDVFITGRNSAGDYIAKLYTNDGMGNFSEIVSNPFEGFDVSSFAFEDIDGDNDQDVLITGRGPIPTQAYFSTLYVNDGMGNFSESTSNPFKPVIGSSVAFADVDGDNDMDVLIAGANNSNIYNSKLYINDGLGNFSESTSSSFEGVTLSSIAFADVDGDTDQDLLITGRSNPGGPIAKLYINDGMGIFSEVLGIPFEPVTVSSIAFADVDGDNDQDAFITGGNVGINVTKLYTNDGVGNFSEVTGLPFEDFEVSSFAFSDVDGDNDQDVLLTGKPLFGIWNSTLFLNDGVGNFSEDGNTILEGVTDSSVDFADVDGDTDPDVLISGRSNSGDPVTKLYTNDISTSTSELVFGANLDLTIFPNPIRFKDLNIGYDSEHNGIVTVTLYDMNGQLISQQKERVDFGSQTITMNIAGLIQGSYIIEVNDGKKRNIAKFIVQ